MLVHSLRSERLEALAEQVRAAEILTPEMVSRVAVETCRRPSAPGQAANAVRLRELIAAGALTEAALALVDLELPQWKLRRVAYDEGGWCCAMSRQRELPEWLDQAVEASHACLPLAILSVYIEALSQIEASTAPSRPSVPQVRDEPYQRLCCDNFA